MAICSGIEPLESLTHKLVRVSIFLFVFSSLEIVIGYWANQFFESVHFPWWIGIAPFVTALVGIFSCFYSCTTRMAALFAPFFWVLLVFATIGACGVADDVRSLEGCYETTTGNGWGENSAVLNSKNCYTSGQVYHDSNSSSNAFCVCSDTQNMCFGLELAYGSDCGTIFSEYYPEVTSVCATDCVLIINFAVAIVFLVKVTQRIESPLPPPPPPPSTDAITTPPYYEVVNPLFVSVTCEPEDVRILDKV